MLVLLLMQPAAVASNAAEAAAGSDPQSSVEADAVRIGHSSHTRGNLHSACSCCMRFCHVQNPAANNVRIIGVGARGISAMKRLSGETTMHSQAQPQTQH